MLKLKHPELLDAALKLLGPLSPEEHEAARVMLFCVCEKLCEPQGETYHESMETLRTAENDVRRLRQRLRSLNPYLSIHYVIDYAFYRPLSPPGRKFYGSLEKLSEPIFKADRELRSLEESLQTAQETVASILKVKGGHGSLRSRIYGPPKSGFASECSVVWLLTGNSLDDGKSSELVRFIHLVYEAATGDESGRGLRDKIAKSRKRMRDMFTSRQTVERYTEGIEGIVQRGTKEFGAPDTYWAAALTLFQGYLARIRP